MLEEFKRFKRYFTLPAVLANSVIITSFGSRGEVTYRITGTSGPPHAPVFEAAVYRGGQVIGTGSGKTKKQAEQAAAVRALENLKAEKS